MIALKLWGGLGNQLFQYAFGKSLAISENKELFFYSIPHMNNKSKSPLEVFMMDIKYLDERQISKFYLFSNSRFLSRIERKIISRFPSVNRKVLVEKALWFHQLENSKATCYDGYWQSYKYFNSIMDELLSEIRLKDKYDLPEGLSREITECNSVSVHIRRGDYLSKANENIYYRCGTDYYKRAISFINKEVVDPVYYIFSDDLFWVKENYMFLKDFDIRYVEYSSEALPNTDLILMSHCRHNIIANSTFSWWGAYLNRNHEKTVIVPKHWYQKTIRYSVDDLIPQGWTQM
jgi:hypothetical protein